jgi:hypothetical protein
LGYLWWTVYPTVIDLWPLIIVNHMVSDIH